MDSGLSYDGRNTDPDKTVVITGGTDDWSYQEEYRLSVLADNVFKESDIGNEIHIDYTEDDEHKILKCRIVEVINSKEVTVSPNRNVPPALRSTMTEAWGFARKFFTGIGHRKEKP